jgi:monoamine oxidase
MSKWMSKRASIRLRCFESHGSMEADVSVCGVPPNTALQLTCQPVTPLAKRRARGAPCRHAAELGRYAA